MCSAKLYTFDLIILKFYQTKKDWEENANFKECLKLPRNFDAGSLR